MATDEEDLNELLMVLSNATRRKILAKLVQERHYPLQLSKELRISQQAITKHLKVMEEHGVIECITVKSREGPPRKLYRTTKNFMVTISVDPKMFDTRGRTGKIATPGSDDYEECEELEEEFKDVLHTQNYKDRVRKLGRLLESTEQELEDLDEKRARLLYLKSLMLREASSLMVDLYPDYSHRAILYSLLEDPDVDIDTISRLLNMTERQVRRILKDLAADDVLPRKKTVRKKPKKKVTVRVRRKKGS
jgi:predicted transcriptional regulator